MPKRTLEIITDRLEAQLLPFIRKPGRYIGGEINQMKQELALCDLRLALCFPDVYEIAMSHTGLAILYDILNRLDGVVAERVFAPWIDAEERMRQAGLPLFSLESKASLRSFDVVGFCLTNELCYTNVLNMLDLGGLAVRAEDRAEDDPLIIAGGGMANCCEPVADFIDAFVLGDGEEAVVALCEHIRETRQAGASKAEMLLQAARRFDWLYVPSLYEVTYHGESIQSLDCTFDRQKTRRSNAVVQDFENCPVPTRPLVPFVEAIHERVSIEIMRGCPGRCRFCQVSYCKRPIRVRSVDRIVDLAEASCDATGFDTVSLLSLSSAEYPHLEELLTRLTERLAGRHIGISVPSLRVDRQLQLLPKLLNSVRKAGLTMAVEAASERLREVIHKPISDEDLGQAVEAAYQAGWQRLKLYFMVGLPGETEDDIRNIVRLSHDLAMRRKEVSGRLAQINVAISWFVPKAHTPFGWVGQCNTDYFEHAKALILEEKQDRRARCLKFKFHDTRRSIVESALGRGDRRLGTAVETAWKDGARFDLWDECFDYDRWQNAFSATGQDLEALAARSFSSNSILPWDHLGGPDKPNLIDHFNAAQERLR
ncbi:TIGR03960 family B12-binding radical SAM protein [Planctomycetota bacterium]